MKNQSGRKAILKLKVDLDHFALLYCALLLERSVLFCQRLDGLFEHLVSSLCLVQKPVFHVIAVLALFVVSLAFNFVYDRFLSHHVFCYEL